MIGRRRVSSIRKARGSSISEFGPVVFVLFIVIFFPLLDLLALGLTYTCGTMLNQAQLREAVLTKGSVARGANGIIKKDIVDAWKNKGIGIFTKADPASIKTKVSYLQPFAGSTDVLVSVSTELTAQPFLNIPFPAAVPGLNAPVPFAYTSQQLLENPQNYDLGAIKDLPNNE